MVEVDLSCNELVEAHLHAVGRFIQNCSTLNHLLLNSCELSDESIELLSSYIIGTTSLEEIGFSNNEDLTEDSIEYLEDMVKGSYLKSIDISDTSIDEDDLHDLNELFEIPVEERSIPIKSSSKSAAKISSQ